MAFCLRVNENVRRGFCKKRKKIYLYTEKMF